MNIAFDMHKVLEDREVFLPIVKELKANGHKVVVLSGVPISEIKYELVELYGYNDISMFDGFYSIIDYFLDNIHKYPNLKIWHNEKGWWIDNEQLWWKSKSIITEEVGIDLLIDDTAQYEVGYLVGRFIHYTDKNKIKEQLDEVIHFS